MYNILQYSLKEYELEATAANTVYYRVKRFENKKYIDTEVSGSVAPSYIVKFYLPSDGVYVLEISTDGDFTSIIDKYVIHNITELLKVKQSFLTDVLTKHSVNKCTHNQYYDIISFHILFDAYNKLVKETFSNKDIVFKQLYKIEYLFRRLKEF